MRYLTKEWYILSQTYPLPEALERQLQEAETARQKAQAQLPEELLRSFMFHDGIIQRIDAGKDYTISIVSPWSAFHKITFCDAIVKQEEPPVGAVWLYQELYPHKSGIGYEAHMLFHKHSPAEGKGISPSCLFDLKVICRDITFEK